MYAASDHERLHLVFHAVEIGADLCPADRIVGAASKRRIDLETETRREVFDPYRAIGEAPVEIRRRARLGMAGRLERIARVGETIPKHDDVVKPRRLRVSRR